jgi:phage shock protein A
MSIFQKLSTLFRSNINDMIARAENPEKMLNQIITDMRDQLSRAKQEVAAAIADERKLRAQVEDEAEQAVNWENRAILAVREGRDDLARQALVRQKEHAERAESLRETWQAQADETSKLKESLKLLNDRIEEAKRKRNLLIAKQKRAQAQRRIQQTMSGLSDTSAFEAFGRMAERIEAEERRNVAESEVTRALQGDTLESEFEQLESGDDAEERLSALKRELGMMPAGEDVRRITPGGKGAGDESGSSGEDVREAELLEEFEKLERRDAR